MIFKKKNRYKPNFKKLITLRENVINNKKILTFKKKKWENFLFHYNRRLKWYNKYKVIDQQKYSIKKYAKKVIGYNKRYRETLHTSKRFKILYGGLSKKYLKQLIKLSNKNNQKTLPYKKIIERIENRIDNILYRAKFCVSIRNARQLISHKKIFVNNTIVKSSSYQVKTGDTVKLDLNDKCLIKIASKNIARRGQTLPHPPKHLYINYRTLQIVVGPINTNSFYNYFTYNLNLNKLLQDYKRQ